MEITLSRKNIKKIVSILILAAVVIVAGAWAWAFQSRQWNATPTAAVDLSQPAISALTDFYNPDRSGDRLVWEDKVCANMTGDGCLLFRKTYAPAIWQSQQQVPAQVSFGEVVESLEDGAQIWKVNVEIGALSTPVYIHVVEGQAGWLLARVLFEDEARARYGDAQ
jgi:hypothetical protein